MSGYTVSPILNYVWRWKWKIRPAVFEYTVTGWAWYPPVRWLSIWTVSTKLFGSSNAKAIHHSRAWMTDRVAHLCNKLLQLQKSDAVLKDSVADYIDILMRGFGTREASHHSNTLKVDLGYSNAQCYCFECVEEKNINISRVNWDDFEYHSNLFTIFDENTQFTWITFHLIFIQGSWIFTSHLSNTKSALF